MEDTAAYTAATLTYKTWALLFFCCAFLYCITYLLAVYHFLACLFPSFGGVWFLCVFCGWEFFKKNIKRVGHVFKVG